MNLQKKIDKLKKQVKKLEEQYKREQEEAALDKLHRAFRYELPLNLQNCKYYVGYEIFNAIESLRKSLAPYVIPYAFSAFHAYKECKYMGRRVLLNPNLDGTTIEIVQVIQ